jgi:hypothetical protein
LPGDAVEADAVARRNLGVREDPGADARGHEKKDCQGEEVSAADGGLPASPDARSSMNYLSSPFLPVSQGRTRDRDGTPFALQIKTAGGVSAATEPSGRGEAEQETAVSETFNIPEEELHWTYVRSGGPGGQNVNKVASKAVLRWDLNASPACPTRSRPGCEHCSDGGSPATANWC